MQAKPGTLCVHDFLDFLDERHSLSEVSSIRQNPAFTTTHWSAVLCAGREMILWGGYAYGPVAADGARFNPVANTWSPIAATGPIGRYGANLGVWTGSELLVFGGYNFGLTPSFFNDAHSYTPPRTLSLYAKP